MNVQRDVGNALRKVVAIVLGVLWLGVVAVAGVDLISGDSARLLRGAVCALTASGVLVSTAHKWIKFFPGLLFYAAIASILAIFGRGAAGSMGTMADGITFLVFFALSAIVALDFTTRAVRPLDRGALLGYVSVVFVMIFLDRTGLAMPLIALAILSLAPLAHRLTSVKARP